MQCFLLIIIDYQKYSDLKHVIAQSASIKKA